MDKKKKTSGYMIFGGILFMFNFFAMLYLLAKYGDVLLVLFALVNTVTITFMLFGIGKNRRMIEELFRKLNIESDEKKVPPDEDLD